MINRTIITTVLVSFCSFGLLYGQAISNPKNAEKLGDSTVFNRAISTDPLLPLWNSFALIYEQQFTKKDAFLIGFWYGKATTTYPKMLEFPGYIRNYAPILAYRRYFWRNLHAEYQLYPGYSIFHEEPSGFETKSFSLFTELRVGYKFDFEIAKLPFMLNLQWPVGVTLFESNEPESFREVRKKDPVFYIFYPNIYIGYRF